MATTRHLPALLCSSLLLSACAIFEPQTAAPGLPPLPERYLASPSSVQPAIDADWWKSFDSPELDELIEQAGRQSHDIAAAVAQLRQAEAQARAAGAARWPALDFQLDSERGDGSGQWRTQHGATLTASYELDAWGRVQASQQAAQASAAASAYDLQAVRLGIQASVANAWLENIALREQIDLAGQDLALARRVLALIEARHAAGAASDLDLSRQRILVAEREKDLSALTRRHADTGYLLARLLGEAGSRDSRLGSLRNLKLPAIDAGLPSQLLTRRPDLAGAEARLQAADADITVARAALLPSIDLSAVLAGSQRELLQVLQNPAYSLLAAINAPIFNGGRLNALHDSAKARRDVLLANYRGAVVNAFTDAQGALNLVASLATQATAQNQVLAQSERSWQLAEVRYRAGAIGMLDLLDAQRTLHEARASTVQIQLARYQAVVSLFRALGGGWQRQDSRGNA